ncbi:hypothetical protein APY03_3683 [Variovorax sp. WDL1]|nr:hypothetical protein APY03_3683 [Variovorax sp. WDL1]
MQFYTALAQVSLEALECFDGRKVDVADGDKSSTRCRVSPCRSIFSSMRPRTAGMLAKNRLSSTRISSSPG